MISNIFYNASITFSNGSASLSLPCQCSCTGSVPWYWSLPGPFFLFPALISFCTANKPESPIVLVCGLLALHHWHWSVFFKLGNQETDYPHSSPKTCSRQWSSPQYFLGLAPIVCMGPFFPFQALSGLAQTMATLLVHRLFASHHWIWSIFLQLGNQESHYLHSCTKTCSMQRWGPQYYLGQPVVPSHFKILPLCPCWHF